MERASILLFTGFFIRIGICVALLIITNQEGGKCLRGPLKYQLDKMAEQNDREVYCNCFMSNGNSLPITFYSSNTNITKVKEEQDKLTNITIPHYSLPR